MPQAEAAKIPSSGDGPSVDSIALFTRFVDGDALAADALFQRYADRLISLARSRLSSKLARRIEPDDVVMSAYRSFYVSAREGRFDVTQPGAVWRLLVQITLHKLYRQIAHHQAERRSVDRESLGGAEQVQRVLAQEPSPEAAAELADELERWLSRLSPDQRKTIELRLQGEEILDIARVLGRSVKTVRRHLEAAKRILLGLPPEQRAISRKLTSENKSRRRPGSRRNQPVAIPGVTNVRLEDYVLEQQIGSGMTGKVYRARHHHSGEMLAVKYLKKEFVGDSPIVTRFLDEAQIVSSLSHPGIIRIHGLGRTPVGGYFIAMDLAANGDLNRRVRRDKLRPHEMTPWLCQAANALQFAHEHGVVHCDLKPSNLLLDAEWNLVVTDFGFARQLGPLSKSPRFFAGTPAFMAPEQIDPTWGEISPTTDIYGLGSVMFFLLFGRPPIGAASFPDLLAETIADRPVEFPPLDGNDVSESLVTICQDCLVKDPFHRISTMSELETRLQASLHP